MSAETSKNQTYWCCILGRPAECNMDCRNCNEAENRKSGSSKEVGTEYLDTKEIKGNA